MSTSKKSSGLSAGQRPTIVIELPAGWGRAAAAGLLGAFLGWVVPVAVAITGFWTLANDPWLRQQNWQDAVDAGSSFWALSLGSPALLGQVSVALIPGLWTLAQLLSLRVFLGRMGQFSSGSVWAAVPAFTLLAVTLSFTTGQQVIWWRVLLGSLAVSGLTAAWVFVRNLRNVPAWAGRLRYAAAGVVLGAVLVAGLFLLGSVAVGYSWWRHHQQVDAAMQAVNAGPLLLILQLTFLPLMAAWAVSWLVGTGFYGASGELISPAVPPQVGLPLPVWQLVPGGIETSPWWMFVLLGVAGGAVLWLLLRKRGFLVVLTIVGCGALSALGFTAAWMGLSTGSLGVAALDRLGPPVWAATLAVGVQFVLPLSLIPLLFHSLTIAWARTVVRKTFGNPVAAGGPEAGKSQKPQQAPRGSAPDDGITEAFTVEVEKDRDIEIP